MQAKSLPPLKALRAFEAVARHSNVSRAADELSVSPSAISHLLRRLQQSLGVELVRRSGRSIVLTDAGLQLGVDLERIFSSLHEAADAVRQSPGKHLVTVSLRPYFSVKWLSPRLGDFWARHPEIQIHLHHTNLETDFIEKKDVDFSIEWSKGNRYEVDQTLLVPGELTPVLSTTLCADSGIQFADDLARVTLLRETDYDSWADWFRVCDSEIPGLSKSIYIDDANVRYQAAIDGQGVELGCRTLISQDIADGRLIAPFEASVSDFSYYLVEPKTRQLTSAAHAFREWILKQV